jgi:RimJ/RimL family protein N-acetyltransferase
MTIRLTRTDDLNDVMQIYADARAFMRENGNPNQWLDGHPALDMIERDILDGKSYVLVEGGEVAAVFYFSVEREPTYEKIDGAWLNDEPFGVVHRIARRRGVKGAGAACINWCLEQCGNVKIDTHQDNIPMRRLLDKLGFTYCGIIWIQNGDERIAFQKTVSAPTAAV